MKKRSEMLRGRVEWQPNVVECEWKQSGTLDIGQKVVVVQETETDILLTDEDVNYMPTQDELQKYNFFVHSEDEHKFFKPYFMRRTTKKHKSSKTERVEDVECVLHVL